MRKLRNLTGTARAAGGTMGAFKLGRLVVTEPTSVAVTATSATATGAIAAPFLAAMGIDVAGLLFGLLGAVIVQCLLPDATHSLKRIAALTVGGMLLAGVTTELAMSYVVSYFSHVSVQVVHNVTAAAIGGFAQPLALLARKRISLLIGSKTPPAAAQPEET